MIPEHMQDRAEEERFARSISNEQDDRPSLSELADDEKPACQEEECCWPDCDCWMQGDGSDD